MLKKIKFFLLVFTSIFIACKGKSSYKSDVAAHAKLIGDWKNYPDGWLYLENAFSAIQDSVYVKNGKFAIHLKQNHGSFYYYLFDNSNLFKLIFIPPGDSLTILATYVDSLIQNVRFEGSLASNNQYLDYLLSYLDSRYDALQQVYQFASFDSLMAFSNRESSMLKSKLNKLLPSVNKWEDSLFLKLEEKRLKWMYIRDICDFSNWYYALKKQPFPEKHKIIDAFKIIDLNDSLSLWLNESSEALSCYFSNEYYRMTKQWKQKSPNKTYFLTDYWNYSLSKYGPIPFLQILVPDFLYRDIVFKLNPQSIKIAKLYFSYNPQPNYKNNYLKSIISSIEKLKQGQPAPNILFTDVTDSTKKYSLKDYLGKNLIIEFGSTYCTGCLQAAKKVENEFEKIKHKPDFLYIYLLVEEASERVVDYVTNNSFSYPVFRVSDHSLKSIHTQYALFVEPRFVWIDKQGNLKNPFFYSPLDENFWKTIENI